MFEKLIMVGGLLCGHFILLNLMIFSWTSNFFLDSRDSDYWSVKFDAKQNCVQKEKIEKLRSQEETNLLQCALETVGFSSHLFEATQIDLIIFYSKGGVDDESGKKKAFNICKQKLGTLVNFHISLFHNLA